MVPARQFIHEVHCSAGFGSLNEFRQQFQSIHQSSPIRGVKFFLYYAATRGKDPLSEAMAFWATSGSLYISILLDSDLAQSEGFSFESVAQAVSLLARFDPQFLIKFARGVAALTDPEALLHALTLAPAIGDYSILLSWLRGLDQNSDSRVRARAAKLICQLRPNKGTIERHLQSNDGRVRASVLEALWEPAVIRQHPEVFPFFRLALNDSHHRVVANALVGLYRLGEYEAIHRMISLTGNKEHLFRAAMAWAMGIVEDSRAIPILENLQADRSYTVRQRALRSLTKLRPDHPAADAALRTGRPNEKDSPLHPAGFVETLDFHRLLLAA